MVKGSAALIRTTDEIRNPEQLWTMQKSKLRLRFPQLHDEDFRYDNTRRDIMLDLLQYKLGQSREELNFVLLGL